MPVTGSGEIKLRADVNEEVNGNDTDNNVSLRSLSEDAGKSVPDALSEFYGYSACSAPSVNTPTSGSQTTSTVAITFTGNANGCALSSVQVGYATSSGGTYTYVNASHSSETGSYTINHTITGLSSNTTYYFRGKAVNSAGTTIGSGILTQATSYDYQTTTVAAYSNYQNINNTDTYQFKSYYQLTNGSYYTSATMNSTYNFAVSGTNGAPSLVHSQNRTNRINVYFSSVAGGCTGVGYGTMWNANSSGGWPNANITIDNFSTLWSTDCRSGYSTSWTKFSNSGDMLLLAAYKETGHEFGAQFDWD